jgi:hypothetical protein
VTGIADLLDRVRAAASAQQPLCITGGNTKQYLGREQQGEPIDNRTRRHHDIGTAAGARTAEPGACE